MMNELAYLDVAGRDAALPGFRCLLDLQRIRRVLGEVPGVRRVRIAQIAYQPQQYALVTYRLESDDGDHWFYAKTSRLGTLPRVWQWFDRLRGSRLADGRPGDRGDRCGVAIREFPNDPRLALEHVVARSIESTGWSVRPEAVPAAIATHPVHLDSLRISSIAYLPEQECVFEFRDASGPQLQVRLYAHRHFATARQLARLVESCETLAVCRVLAECRQQRSLWLQLPVASESVTLGNEREQVLQNLATVGRALREVHCQSVPDLRWSTIAESQHLQDLQTEKCTRLLPRRAAWAESLHQRLQSELAQVVPRYVSCQGNVRWNQLRIAGEQVAFLSYDHACYDHPVSDLGSLLADHWIELGSQAAQPDQVDVEAAQAALCAGYRPPYGNTDRLLELFAARALWRRLTEPFDRNQCQWPTRIEVRLEQVQSLLSGTHSAGRPRSSCDAPRTCHRSP